MGSLDYRLPVPTHVVGTDLITVQYDRAMIPYVVGLLKNKAFSYVFDPGTGDPDLAVVYMDTLIEQLTNEVVMTPYPYNIKIDPETLNVYAGYPLRRPIAVTPAASYQTASYQTAAPISGSYDLPIVLPAGTVNVIFHGVKSNNSCICDIKLDGLTPISLDLYAAANSSGHHILACTGTIAAGTHNLEILITGKNASSSGYYIIVEYIEVQVTP